jgi:hypothetical protein
MQVHLKVRILSSWKNSNGHNFELTNWNAHPIYRLTAQVDHLCRAALGSQVQNLVTQAYSPPLVGVRVSWADSESLSALLSLTPTGHVRWQLFTSRNRRSELVHCTARALIIKILLHTAPLHTI